MTSFTKYYSVVRANSSGGVSYAASDGVITIDIDPLDKNLRLKNGKGGCNEKNKVTSKINVQSNQSILSYTNISVLEEFTMFIRKDSNKTSNENNKVVIVKGFEIYDILQTDLHQVMQMVALSDNAEIIFKREIISGEEINLHKCQFDQPYVLSQNKISFAWTDVEINDYRPTHFEISIVAFAENSVKVIQSTTTEERTVTLRNITLNPRDKYFGVVKACFSRICSKPVFGSALKLFPRDSNMNITAKLSKEADGVYKIGIKISHTNLPLKHSLMRWTLAMDSQGRKRDIHWNYSKLQNESMISVNISVSELKATSPRYVCVQKIYSSWVSQLQCAHIQGTFDYNSNDISIYIVDTKNPNLVDIRTMSHSSNLGTNVQSFENGNLLYTSSKTKFAGIIARNDGRQFEAYLMRRKFLPRNKEDCDSNIHCLHYTKVQDGFITYPYLHVRHNDELYICVRTNEDLANRTGKQSEECSDKLMINDLPPSNVKINVKSSLNGYTSTNSFLDVKWTVPDLNVPLLEYKYCIGTSPGLDDVLPFTSSLHDNRATIINATLNHGFSYFVSVKAVDRSGLESLSVSSPFTIDLTPPIPGSFFIGFQSGFEEKITKDSIPVFVENFRDDESGIDEISIRFGGTYKEYISNLDVERGHARIKVSETLLDGHKYTAALRVSNRAGLRTTIESNEFLVDNSPPIQGFVFDGADKEFDADFQTNTQFISASWGNFTDPHSEISYYRVGLVTSEFRANVFTLTNVGLKNDYTWKGEFIPGMMYYVMVEACNGVNLCSHMYSDGIILDKTPPVTGLVTIGQSKHESFVPDKSSISFQWIGFEDPESNIQKFEWCIGTMIYSCNIHEKENAMLSNRIFKSHMDLPVNISIYVTVFAYNNAGLSSSATSRKTTVDTTPPVLIKEPSFMSLGVSDEVPSHQCDTSLLKLKWKFEEKESSVIEIRIVIKNTRVGEELSDIIVRDNIDYAIIPLSKNDKLLDGDSIVGVVSACNMARLCITETTQSLIVDSSRPSQGGFSNPMTWTQIKDTYELLVNWYGFSDEESGISYYYFTADKTYSGFSLSNGTKEILGNRSSMSFAVNTNKCNLTEGFVLTLWAVNGAGLASTSAKVTMRAKDYNYTSTSGHLEIERHSCNIHYCNNDCTCSVIGKKCSPEANVINRCMPTSQNVNLVDENIMITNLNPNSSILSSGTCVEINFEKINITAFDSVLRYEWSVGLQNELPGVGFYDEEDYPWKDIGLRKADIECLPPHKHLENGETYIVYVKSWLSDSSFVTLLSNEFKIDTTAPFIKMGKHISVYKKNSISRYGVRFFKSRKNSLCTRWDGVFSDGKGNISRYFIMLGTESKADDIFRKRNIGLQSEFCFQPIHLAVGVDYIFSVTAQDQAGMSTTLESLPFMIDDIPPTTGSVFNTNKFKDKLYTSSSSTLGASWNGFQDHGSYVRTYEYRLRDLHGSTSPDHGFIAAGFQDAIFIDNLNLVHGKSYLIDVRAVDAAGNIGQVATSPPITVDLSPPVGFQCQETIHEHVNMSLKSGSLNLDLSVEPNVSFVLQFTLKDEHPEAIDLKINNESIMLNFNFVIGIGFRTEYQYVPLIPGPHRVSLSSNSINFEKLNTDIIYCKMQVENESDAIQIKQLGSSSLQVNTHIFDLESGINVVSISLGLTPFGQQILNDQHIFSNSKIIDMYIPHNTTVFALVRVTNGAGLVKRFSSQSLVVDNTSPVIDHLTVHLEDNSNNGTDVRLIGSFKVTDRESGVQACYVAIGTIPSQENIQPWTFKEKSQEHFISKPFNVIHGMKVFGKVRCLNTIGLSIEKTTDFIEVILQPPESKTASIEFVQDECIGNDIPTVSNKTPLILHWKGFADIASIKNYSIQISATDQPVVPWRSTNKRDYGFINNLDSEDGSIFVAEVMAYNSLQKRSTVFRQQFQVESRQPKSTDTTPTVSRDEDVITVDWSNLFESHSGLNMTYEVNIGSQNQFSDLLHSFKTTRRNVAFEILQHENFFSLFVSIRAELCTKEFNIYYGTLALN